MAIETLAGLALGSALEGTTRWVKQLTSAKSAINQLEKALTPLLTQQEELKKSMASLIRFNGPQREVKQLEREIESVGELIQELTDKQKLLNKHLKHSEELSEKWGKSLEAVKSSWSGLVEKSGPFVVAATNSATHQDTVRDLGIAAGLDSRQESAADRSIRESAAKTRHGLADMTTGAKVLMTEGGVQDRTKLDELGPMTELMGKLATANNTDTTTAAKLMISLRDNHGIGNDVQKMTTAVNKLLYGARMSTTDPARFTEAFEQIDEAMSQRGETDVASISAALGVLGTDDAAVGDIKQWLSRMDTDDQRNAYLKQNIHYNTSMQNLTGKGHSKFEASFMAVDAVLNKQSKPFQDAWNQAIASGSQAAMMNVLKKFNLSGLFGDEKMLALFMKMKDGLGQFQDARKTLASNQPAGMLESNYQKRTNTLGSSLTQVSQDAHQFSTGVGDAINPIVKKGTDAASPLIQRATGWVNDNPGWVKAIIGAYAGFHLGKIAVNGVRLTRATVKLARAHMGTAKAARGISAGAAGLGGGGPSQGGRFASIVAKSRNVLAGAWGRVQGGVRVAATGVNNALNTIKPYALTFLTKGVDLFARGWSRASALIMPLLRMVGIGIRVLFANPIGLAVTAVAGAAYLIYKNWDTIGPMFTSLWEKVKGIFAGAMEWFASLPDKFMEFGKAMINALIGGLIERITNTREVFVNASKSISSFFSNLLRDDKQVEVTTVASPVNVAAQQATNRAVTAQAASAKSVVPTTLPTIHFNPVFQMPAGVSGDAVKGQIKTALNMSLHELEQLIKRVVEQQARRAY
ncbi:TP901 family phage tail tape measure protein [Chitinivorax tropicus]|uniref:TP901 family phage tail tape measure protein n=1 Tax=Chitinivorax tropicus TaxID=714531 RepID=A0A840MFH5_9PROT|nr:phage tail tape measure protein [Chitinivorax tropicus]MBB5017418.1 TP901 family phage tail tape measure protein [Chitinivorax tropicus]